MTAEMRNEIDRCIKKMGEDDKLDIRIIMVQGTPLITRCDLIRLPRRSRREENDT